MHLNKTQALGNVAIKTKKVVMLAVTPTKRTDPTLHLTLATKGKLNTIVQEYVHKGDRLYVEGQLDPIKPHTLNVTSLILLGSGKAAGRIPTNA